MRTIDRMTDPWTRLAAVAAVAGGAVWLAKQVAIGLTVLVTDDGTPESLPIAVLYLAGAALLAVAASGPVARMTASWSTALRVPVAVAVSPMIFWGSFTLVDALCDAVAGPNGNWWVRSEGAIVLTALIFLALGAHALVRQRRSQQPVAV
jgi:hypothetical protein